MDSRIRCEMSQSESLIMEYLWKMMKVNVLAKLWNI